MKKYVGVLSPGKEAPGTHWKGGWEGPKVALNDMERSKFFTLPGLDIPPWVVRAVASRYTD
jgi:hypothetical protein